MENNFEFDSYDEFINPELNKPCTYKLIVLSETADEELYILLDKSDNYQCLTDKTLLYKDIRTQCSQQIKNYTDIEVNPDDIKFWFIEDKIDKIILNYVICLNQDIDERWIKLNTINTLNIEEDDYTKILKLYKYVTKKNLYDK